MRLILTILFLWSFVSNATIYYVDNAGNDNNNGTSTGTSWQTIAKVNAGSFSPGDQILFKKGGTWNERLNPPSSGSVGNVIIFGSYGTGAMPIITGFQSVTGWSNVGNVWTATFSNSVNHQNTVYVNGGLRAKGRYPNYGWLPIVSHVGKTQITGGLSGTPNYTGGEIVIRNNHWTLDHLPITNQSGGTIDIGNDPKTGLGIFYNLVDGNGYFIQNIASVLDTLNEWSYDTTTKGIKVYANTQPTVKASAIDTLVSIVSKSYITFDGIYFEGGNMIAVSITGTSSHITITNCDLQDNGADGISSPTSSFITITNSNFRNHLNGSIMLFNPWTGFADCDDLIVTGNTITNNGIFKGMGKNRFQTYTALYAFGDRGLVSENIIDSTGYNGIQFFGTTFLVDKNYIRHFCFVKDDGAAIGTWMGGGVKPTGGVVRKNIILDGSRASDGNLDTAAATSGIYMDNETNYVLVDSNTVYNMPLSGIFLHLSHYVTVRHNTLVSAPFLVVYQADNTFKRNIVYTETFPLIRYQGGLSISDSNYLISRGDTTKSILYFGARTLTYWRTTLGFDLNSSVSPSGITSTEPIFEYNATTSNRTVSLTGTYIDANGGSYTGSIVIQPFTSALLFKATVDVVVPTPVNNGFKRFKFKRIRLI